jgi:hypothetical protein
LTSYGNQKSDDLQWAEASRYSLCGSDKTLTDSSGGFKPSTASGKQPSELADEIFDAFRKNKQTRDRMADILITMFAESFNYAQSKTLMTYLDELPIWEPSYPARLRSAIGHNDQVRDSFGVSDRVEKLIAKRQK